MCRRGISFICRRSRECRSGEGGCENLIVDRHEQESVVSPKLVGNRIEYTLDSAGSRQSENAFDSSGALARTESRYPLHKVAIWKPREIPLSNGADVNAAGEDDDAPVERLRDARDK
jgi:hypothetical protein